MADIRLDNLNIEPYAFELVQQVGAIQAPALGQVAAPATSVTSLNGLRGDLNNTAAPATAGFQVTVSASGTSVQLGISVASTITPANVTTSGNVKASGLLIEGVGAVLTISANAVTPTNNVHKINNAGGLIKTINAPAGFTGGIIWLIAGSTPYTTDATGNISRAIAPAAGQAIAFAYDGTTFNPAL